MKLPFIDRNRELTVLKKVLAAPEPSLAIVYGRRRCGKSRLLQQIGKRRSAYFLADQSEQALQRNALAGRIASEVPGFDLGTYPSWREFFDSLNQRISFTSARPFILILDEFPYLVAECPSLPSILQHTMDTASAQFHLVLCGSSQRMMKGLAFDEKSPLYGRAREAINIAPLKPGWIWRALGLNAKDAIRQYAVWGGIPRYWELAREFTSFSSAIKELIMNRNGILHREPGRILLDDLRSNTQPHSVLSAIGSGIHRLSEIAARLQKPAMNLARPAEILLEMGLIRREVPFGESPQRTKRTLYVIADPFMRFWYRYVQPNLSALEEELYDEVMEKWSRTQSHFYGMAWEDLARQSLPHLTLFGKKWKRASRWWGKQTTGQPSEIDLVSESRDGSCLLLGEAKWGTAKPKTECDRLAALAPHLPFVKGRRVMTACWLPGSESHKRLSNVVTPEGVLRALK